MLYNYITLFLKIEISLVCTDGMQEIVAHTLLFERSLFFYIKSYTSHFHAIKSF